MVRASKTRGVLRLGFEKVASYFEKIATTCTGCVATEIPSAKHIFIFHVINTPMPTSNHFIGKVTQKALIYKDGKILFNRDVGHERYDLPGGRIDFNEAPADGLAREIQEELGVEVKVKNPVYICQTVWGTERSPHIFIAYEVELISPVEMIIADGTEIAEARWVLPSELSTITIHKECLFAITKFLEDKNSL